jgi:hypothetical protein
MFSTENDPLSKGLSKELELICSSIGCFGSILVDLHVGFPSKFMFPPVVPQYRDYIDLLRFRSSIILLAWFLLSSSKDTGANGVANLKF